MMLCKNTKAMVGSPDVDPKFFDIFAGVFQRDSLAPYLFLICLDNLLWTSIDLIKENGFTLKKKSRWYHAETITDEDYADDLAQIPLPKQYNLEHAAEDIGFYLNANTTECCIIKEWFFVY